MKKLNDFLSKLEEKKIYYRLNRIRDSIMVEIAVPGQRWEVEFLVDGEIQIEKFFSNGEIYNDTEIEMLFKLFSD